MANEPTKPDVVLDGTKPPPGFKPPTVDPTPNNTPTTAANSSPIPKPKTAEQIAQEQQQEIIRRSNEVAEAGLFFQIQQAEQRQQNIAEALSEIDRVFGDRSPVYDQYRDSVFDLNKQSVLDEHQGAGRNLKFALSRRGQTGGAVDIDQHADLSNTLNDGLLRAQNFADNSRSNLQASDNNIRNSLYGMAASGAVGNSIGAIANNQLQAQQPTVGTDPGISSMFAQYAAPSITNLAGALGQQQGFNSYRPRTSYNGGSNYQGTVS